MRLMPQREFALFKQEKYDNIFYYCDHTHPFIAFTTCFCPLCDNSKELKDTTISLERVDTALDVLTENHTQLVAKVYKTNPELLI